MAAGPPASIPWIPTTSGLPHLQDRTEKTVSYHERQCKHKAKAVSYGDEKLKVSVELHDEPDPTSSPSTSRHDVKTLLTPSLDRGRSTC